MKKINKLRTIKLLKNWNEIIVLEILGTWPWIHGALLHVPFFGWRSHSLSWTNFLSLLLSQIIHSIHLFGSFSEELPLHLLSWGSFRNLEVWPGLLKLLSLSPHFQVLLNCLFKLVFNLPLLLRWFRKYASFYLWVHRIALYFLFFIIRDLPDDLNKVLLVLIREYPWPDWSWPNPIGQVEPEVWP